MRRPSLTAVKVARNLVFLAGEPRYAALLPAGSVEATSRLLEAAGLLKPWQRTLLGLAGFRRFTRWVGRRTTQGVSLHLGLRKRFVDDEARAAIAAGACQMLVVGAGFDTLCSRLAAERADLPCVEVDAPATMRVKRAASLACEAARPNLHQLDLDLESGSLGETLAGVEGWQPGARTVIVAEAVLMYLPPPAVEAFLEAARAQVGAGSRLILSYMEPNAQGSVGRGIDRLTRISLRFIGEPLRWGVYLNSLGPFLEDLGWRLLDEDPNRVDLQSRYLRPTGLEAEWRVVVERVAVAEAM